MNLAFVILVPLLGTTIGAACVFFMKDQLTEKLKKILLGFASGVMIAASVWSLLIPSIEMTGGPKYTAWIPAACGFLLGILFLLVLDNIIPHLHIQADENEGPPSKLKKTTMMVLAVTLHNFPEGMAVGVAAAGMISGKAGMTVAGAFALAIGIAIQNFPEGAIISLPLKADGYSKLKAFRYGFLSGIVEPIGAIITLLLTNLITNILPYLLSFAAGAMIYVVIEELIPESHNGKSSEIGTIVFAFGFILMMILDITLS